MVHIAVFLKAPVPGRVKSRLCPPLSAQQAADLYTSMVADTLELVARSPAESILLFHEGAAPHAYLAPSLVHLLGDRVVEVPQRGADLGERLTRALEDAATQGRLPLLILGSDSPDLPVPSLLRAMDALTTAQLVLGPASDGGIWCIGVRHPIEGLLGGLPWSQPSTAEAVRERAAGLGIQWLDVDGWTDIDTHDDLIALRRRLQAGQSQAPWTRRWLARYAPGAGG